ncbi:NADPH-dependent FMN reductase [Knoellia subterranea]|uniref:NADPH-dependent FMN reductase n=1 Tax=Knoellia subterranea KCTC 19937 TaxID=1385521 RepID=A0A0A0JQT0_9MICO|nr:NAD(P)H-dependent oxidoreductase [Knoellia subterranea]KGN39508.1 NADPH-dependent FMN reductase [Knoellia subterranea KCTC 19937]
MNNLSIIVSSTRPGRIGHKVTEWVGQQANPEQWQVTVLDLAAIDLPFLDEEDMPKNGNYAKPHTQAWASAIFESDAIVVVTPQYNRSFPAPIKNAVDYLFAEWDSKPIGIVGYGWSGAGDARADLAKVLTHVSADVVGDLGLSFPEQLAVEGDVVDVEGVAASELATLLDSLHSKVLDLAEVPAQS